MGQDLNACEAAMVARLVAFMAALAPGPAVASANTPTVQVGWPLPVLEDVNVESSQDPATTGYIQCWPMGVVGEEKLASGGDASTFDGTFYWAVTVCTPRNTGKGPATEVAGQIAGHFRQLQLGDLTVENLAVEPVPKQPTDPYYQEQVLIRGSKTSDYAPAA